MVLGRQTLVEACSICWAVTLLFLCGTEQLWRGSILAGSTHIFTHTARTWHAVSVGFHDCSSCRSFNGAASYTLGVEVVYTYSSCYTSHPDQLDSSPVLSDVSLKCSNSQMHFPSCIFSVQAAFAAIHQNPAAALAAVPVVKVPTIYQVRKPPVAHLAQDCRVCPGQFSSACDALVPLPFHAFPSRPILQNLNHIWKRGEWPRHNLRPNPFPNSTSCL